MIIIIIAITITVIVAFLFLLLLLQMSSEGASVVDRMRQNKCVHSGVAEALVLVEFTQRYQPTLHNIAEERRPRAPTSFILVTSKNVTRKSRRGWVRQNPTVFVFYLLGCRHVLATVGQPQVTKIYNEEKIYSTRTLVVVHILSFQ